MRTSLDTAVTNTKMKEKKKKTAYLMKASSNQESPAKYLCLHCQPLNEAWEGVHPGSTPSGHATALHPPELLWVGPAFPPGAQSLLQAVTEHCHRTPAKLLLGPSLHFRHSKGRRAQTSQSATCALLTHRWLAVPYPAYF